MVLVFVMLFVFLGHLRAAVIVALTIPLSLLFTFTMMVLIGQSANLISLGAIDFGIIVDATLIMVESIFFHLAHAKTPGLTVHQQIVRAARQVGQPIFYSTAIIVVAFIPLFTMTGVPGKIFAPMSITYGFALLGALLMAFTLAPVLCSFLLTGPISEEDTWSWSSALRTAVSAHAPLGVGSPPKWWSALAAGLFDRGLRRPAVCGRGVHAGAGRGQSLGAGHDAGRHFIRPSGAAGQRNPAACSGSRQK